MNMIINAVNDYNTNFGAKFKGKKNILKRLPDGSYIPKKGRVIEFDVNNQSDVGVLQTLSILWGEMFDGQTLDFTGNIADEAMKCFKNRFLGPGKFKFFGLTTQKENFDVVDPEQVLGLMEYNYFSLFSENNNKVVWLQTHPKYAYKKDVVRDIRHIGDALTDFITEYSNKPVEIHPTKSSNPFYDQLNGVQREGKNCILQPKKKYVKSMNPQLLA